MESRYMSGNVIVIGAGAAGLMAAATAAENGNRVTVLEKNEKAGKKIYITGKGRCNLTNDCDTVDYFNHVARNHRFLYSAIYGFDHEMVKEYFEKNGCPVKVERGNRVFPVSDHASDVTAALLRDLNRNGGQILYHTAVHQILTGEDGDGLQRVRGVRLKNGKEMKADAVILCTGGLSYPSTGSTGEGLSMVGALGVDVTPTAPSLVPFETRESWCRSLQGLALKNVAVKIFPQEAPAETESDFSETENISGSSNDLLTESTSPSTVRSDSAITGSVSPSAVKPDFAITASVSPEAEKTASAMANADSPGSVSETGAGKAAAGSEEKGRKNRKRGGKKKNRPVYEAFGEMLFTHFGLSGPIILTASCYCDFISNPHGFKLSMDLKPALTQQQLEERITREFTAAPDRHLPGAVRPLFPARLAEAVTELSGLETHRRAGSFSAQEIARLAALIKNITVTITGTRGYNEAIITRGGISVKEINPSTMEFRRIRGLYAAGEILDVDAETGGYNLQIAWSTGRLAGMSV